MAQFDTSANIINNAGIELGILFAPLANPFASADQNIVQLCALLTRVGRMLVRANDWVDLTVEYTLDTANGVFNYPLPDDFQRMKRNTAWNRSTRWPMGPPVSSGQWQMLQARTAAGMVTLPYRIWANQLYVYPTPTSAEHLYFEYISSLWVETALSPGAPARTDSTLGTDTPWFDEPLITCGLKLAFLRAKGRDTSNAQEEYDEAYRAAAGGDGAAPVISIVDGSGEGLLGGGNLPDTGYGS